MPSGVPHVYAAAHTQIDEIAIRDTNIGTITASYKRKRKLGEIDDDEEDEDDNTIAASLNAESAGRLSRETTAFVSLTAQEHAQRRAAGLQPGAAIPSHPFPHQDLDKRGKRYDPFSAVKKELLEVVPPLPHLDQNVYAHRPFATNKDHTTLREQHVAVLTVLLHTCLEKGDYVRAGRAWSLLLRSGNMTRDTQVRQGIFGMDLRANDRWGIGAELLMRRQPKDTKGKAKAGTSNGDETGEKQDGYLDYTDHGFKLARHYYERLIVQYPSGARRRIGAQATTFYTAMFSAWIYEVSQRYKNAPTTSVRRQTGSDDSSSDDEAPEEDSPQLQDVKAIARRMDEIIESPPYDKVGEILVMRGMVDLWVIDLSTGLEEREKADMMERIARWFRKAERYGEELDKTARKVVEEWQEEPEDDEVVVEDESEEDEVMRDDSED